MDLPTGKATDAGFLDPLYLIREIAENTLQKIQSQNTSDAREILLRASKALSETVEQAGRIIQMIDHLRSLSRSRPGADTTASIHDCTHQVLRAMQYEYPLKNITFLKILPHDLSPVAMSPQHLETVLFQLICHARQRVQGQKSGILTLEAAEKIYLTPENSSQKRFTLRLSNSGPEIDAKDMPHLFDPFLSPDKHGFGLYLVRKIVEHYNGIIQVETHTRGTSLYLEIPS